MKKRCILSFILAAIFIINTLIVSACADNSGNGSKDTGTSTDTESDSESLSTLEPLEIPKTNYDGYTFTFLTANVSSFFMKVCVDEMTGDAMNDAFFDRNLAVEEMLNVKIRETALSDMGGLINQLRNSITAGDRAYDAAFLVLRSAANAAVAGYCLDFRDLPYVDLTKSWWNQSATEQLSIGGTTYMVASDISVADKDVMWVLFFDKEHAENYQLEDLYELVSSGKWTFEKFYEYILLGERDLNNDGKMNMKDQYGLITHNENYMGMWMGAGETLASLDNNKMPQITWNSEKFSNVFDKIAQIMGSTATHTTDIGFISSGLKNGQALFATEVVSFIRKYRENDREFGILPIPKYSESQPDYYTYVALNSQLMVVGKDVAEENMARTSEILEAMAAKGKEIMMPGYYEVSLKSRSSRDEQSAAMLDIIFASRMYDLGVIYDWGSVTGKLNSPTANVASVFASSQKSMTKAMENTLNKMGY